MAFRLKLSHNYGYTWNYHNDVYAKGYAFLDGELYQGKSLAKLFSEFKDINEIEKVLPKLKGLFAVIMYRDDVVYLVEDITRTFPIFYAFNEGDVIITDDTFYPKNHFEPDKDSCAEFLRCLYVTGPYTLLEGVYQVQAGEIVRITSDGGVYREFYHEYVVKKDEIKTEPYNELAKEFYETINRAVDRLIAFADGDTIVIPLSGGYDSRAIAALLKKNGYEDVICYTYGRPDSTEVNTARDVARALGYEWLYVEISDDIVPPNYPNEKWFLEFYKYAFNHASTIHLQDFFVFKHLHESNLIPKDSIVVPGHSGDFLGGSHLRKLPLPKTREDIWKRALAMHYVLNEHIKLPVSIEKKFRDYLSRYPEDVLAYSIDDNWNMKNRQAKFIINSNRTYEFFGYKHAVPLWDLELVEFFRRLPLEYKYDRILYNEVLEREVFKPLGVLITQAEKAEGLREKFYHRVFHSWGIYKSLRYLAELHLPYWIKRPLRDLVWPDENNMYSVARPILNELKRKYYFSEFHGIVAEWCLKVSRIWGV